MSDINEVRERLERACIAGMDTEYVDDVVALLDDHERLNELSGNSEQLQPAPAADPEDVRIVRIIASKIDEGRLDHPGLYKNGRLSAALRNLLALIDGQAKNLNEQFGIPEELRTAIRGFLAASWMPSKDEATDEMRQTYAYWHKQLIKHAGARGYVEAEEIALQPTKGEGE